MCNFPTSCVQIQILIPWSNYVQHVLSSYDEEQSNPSQPAWAQRAIVSQPRNKGDATWYLLLRSQALTEVFERPQHWQGPTTLCLKSPNSPRRKNNNMENVRHAKTPEGRNSQRSWHRKRRSRIGSASVPNQKTFTLIWTSSHVQAGLSPGYRRMRTDKGIGRVSYCQLMVFPKNSRPIGLISASVVR